MGLGLSAVLPLRECVRQVSFVVCTIHLAGCGVRGLSNRRGAWWLGSGAKTQPPTAHVSRCGRGCFTSYFPEYWDESTRKRGLRDLVQPAVWLASARTRALLDARHFGVCRAYRCHG